MAVSLSATVKLTDPDYYTEPPVSELKLDQRGDCWIEEFTIGHHIYGKASFHGKTNVAKLDLDSVGREAVSKRVPSRTLKLNSNMYVIFLKFHVPSTGVF